MSNIGLIVGSGELPLMVIAECKNKNITPFIAKIKNFADDEKYKNFTTTNISFGQIGKAVNFFKKNNVKEIIFAGAVKKPSLKTIFPDLTGFFLLLKLLKTKFLGDDNILRCVINFAEEKGFSILPVHKFLGQEIPQGQIGDWNLPNDDYKIDIELGVKVLKQLGELDIGQAIAIQNGMVIAIECIEGTQKMLEKCKDLKYNKGRKPILVKMKKTSQTDKADLPAIGAKTIEQLKDSDFAGVVIDSKNSIMLEKEKTITLANEKKIFIYGY